MLACVVLELVFQNNFIHSSVFSSILSVFPHSHDSVHDSEDKCVSTVKVNSSQFNKFSSSVPTITREVEQVCYSYSHSTEVLHAAKGYTCIHVFA